MTPPQKPDLVEIVEHALDLRKYLDAVRHPGAGAIVSFHGTTRDTFEEHQVVELQYEAYAPMAISQLKEICAQAREAWSIVGVAVAHRIGVVPVGEESVVVAVSSIHRKEALEACQFVIDELKASAPIWKKEVYKDGAVWKQNAEFNPSRTRHCCSKSQQSNETESVQEQSEHVVKQISVGKPSAG